MGKRRNGGRALDAVENSYENKEQIGEQDSLVKSEYMSGKCSIIGKNIRLNRRLRRFSVENLAEFLNLSESYVGLLERGDRCPSLKIVFKLCELYGITPNDLLLDSKDTEAVVGLGEEKAVYGVRAQETSILSLLRILNESEADFVIETIKSLRKMTKKEDQE